MSAAKHTPGPWFEIINRGVEGIGAGADKTDGDYLFAGERICEFTTINPRNAANARLIAAAPELLEALQPFASRNSSGETITITVRTADIARARAAIAKATGSAS